MTEKRKSTATGLERLSPRRLYVTAGEPPKPKHVDKAAKADRVKGALIAKGARGRPRKS